MKKKIKTCVTCGKSFTYWEFQQYHKNLSISMKRLWKEYMWLIDSIWCEFIVDKTYCPYCIAQVLNEKK